ncbi:copper resistance CopC family protein [Kutzneria albida]|uniref:CopC domain-containing protein n=1 Tax=Kutzneria albida DSM 43870 TaxID=1449976 RepID=W5WE44_9PSEU|nr:copper resistance CopC family protein [Kutzneria albida]AHH96444.1 hypothetical protein KALB_3076 [Kutzneria albida DSM 43870]
MSLPWEFRVTTCTGLVAALIGLNLVLGVAPASAHNVLVSSDPPDGASISAGPNRVQLSFDLPVEHGLTTLVVTGPDGGSHWEGGPPTVSGGVVSAPLSPLGPAGRYTVDYRIISADGHPVSGRIGFQLTTAGRGTPVAALEHAAPVARASSADEASVPPWVWLAGVAAVIAGGAILAHRLARPGS